jgi:hypothetical protein
VLNLRFWNKDRQKNPDDDFSFEGLSPARDGMTGLFCPDMGL